MRVYKLDALDNIPSKLRKAIQNQNIDAWVMENVLFVPFCQVMDILVEHEKKRGGRIIDVEQDSGEEIRQHLYELSYAIDTYSAAQDYKSLRKTHYDNIDWIQRHGLTGEYYKVFFEHLMGERSYENQTEN